MSTDGRFTKFVTREGRGIEIGPWCHPIVPKREGYNCLVLDVYDTVTLRQRAKDDPSIPDAVVAAIEEVDLVGSSSEIAELVARRNELGTFDYVVSSNNFEHLPDPVRFLRGCEQVLKVGGGLTMTVPDRRGCFDYFRPHSTLAELLEAYFEQRRRPTQAQIFERWSLHARAIQNGVESISFPIGTSPAAVVPYHSLHDAFQQWQDFVAHPDEVYRDTHCWVFTPATFELIVADLRALGLLSLEVVEIVAGSSEFIVHLKRPAVGESPGAESQRQCCADRPRLMRHAHTEVGGVEPTLGEGGTKASDLERALAERDAKIKGLEQAVAQLNSELDVVHRSNSWKLTAPLRRVRGKLRQLVGRAVRA